MINEVAFRRLAADLIREYGWRQGGFGGREDGFSITGAIETATPIKQVSLIAWKIKGELEVEDLEAWNDDPDRTIEQVIAALMGDSEKSHPN